MHRKNYENLANAIIEQAVTDYRRAAKFLKKHPRTESLEAVVATQLADKEKRREEWKNLKIPKEREEKSKEERLLAAIRESERMAAETERFFHSKWFAHLTSLDGQLLFEHIKKELEDE